MNGLIIGWTVMFATVFMHLLAWRLRLVRRTVRNLLALHATSIGLVAVLVVATDISVVPPSWVVLARSLLVSESVFLVYLSFYTAVELDSTSSVILLQAERAGELGVREEDLYELLNDEDLIYSRLEELVRNRWITRDRGLYRPALRGRLFIGLVRLARLPFTREGVGG